MPAKPPRQELEKPERIRQPLLARECQVRGPRQ